LHLQNELLDYGSKPNESQMPLVPGAIFSVITYLILAFEMLAAPFVW